MSLFFKLMFLLILGYVSSNCTPNNWNYAWTKVGNAWFTRIERTATWVKQMEHCKGIDPAARSTIASIRTQNELLKTKLRFPGEHFIGAFEIGSSGQWYWWNTYKPNEKITKFFWRSGEPNQDHGENEACVSSKGNSDHGWNDISCNYQLRALCEIRC